MLVTRVEKHKIKTNHKLYLLLDNYSFLSKNLYNYANYHIRQIFIICSKLSKGEEVSSEQIKYLGDINLKVHEYNKYKTLNYEKAKNKAKNSNKDFNKKLGTIKPFGIDHKYPSYDFIEYLVKEGIDYTSLMAQSSQQTLKILDRNWKSFFESIKSWKTSNINYTGRPKLPKYKKKNGRNIIVLTNQNCKLLEGCVQLPLVLEQFKLKTNIKGNLKQVRMLPRNKSYIIEVVYTVDVTESKEDNNRYLSVDLGINNLATIGNNVGAMPIIINGKSLKAINQYYNKKISYYRGIAKRMNNKDYSNRMNRLTTKRNNKVSDYLHKASKKIVNDALTLNCNTIVIGNNKGWKREINIGTINNQSFVSIPYQRLIEIIQYKAENEGINVLLSEESYTSGTSFLDNEPPIKEYYNKARRVKRGLFKSNKGIYINADLNGAYQILKKVVPNVFSEGIEGVGLHPVRVKIS